MQTFHVSGTVLTKSVYYWETNQGEKTKEYDDPNHDSMKIEAISQEAAIKYFRTKMVEIWYTDRHNIDDTKSYKTRNVTGFANIKVQSESSFKASSENNMLLKSAKPVKYNFFQSDDQYLKDNGYCVIDTFVGVYGKLIQN